MALIKAVVVAAVPVAALIMLTTFHPVLRSVEPQVMDYQITVMGELSRSEHDIVLDAASIALASWGKGNPGLVFEEGVGGVTITFTDWLPGNFVNGIAVCPFWVGSEDGCHIIVSANIVRELSVPARINCTADTVAHELGHVLGFMHTGMRGDLMHGPAGSELDWAFDRGPAFAVPDRRGPCH